MGKGLGVLFCAFDTDIAVINPRTSSSLSPWSTEPPLVKPPTETVPHRVRQGLKMKCGAEEQMQYVFRVALRGPIFSRTARFGGTLTGSTYSGKPNRKQGVTENEQRSHRDPSRLRCSHTPCLLGRNIPVRGDEENLSSQPPTGRGILVISRSTAGAQRQLNHSRANQNATACKERSESSWHVTHVCQNISSSARVSRNHASS